MTFISCRQSNNNSGSLFNIASPWSPGFWQPCSFSFLSFAIYYRERALILPEDGSLDFMPVSETFWRAALFWLFHIPVRGLLFSVVQLFSYPWLDTFFSAKENIKSESGLWDIWFFWYSVQYLFLWKTYGTVFVKSLLIIAVFPLLSVFSSSIWQLYFYLLL